MTLKNWGDFKKSTGFSENPGILKTEFLGQMFFSKVRQLGEVFTLNANDWEHPLNLRGGWLRMTLRPSLLDIIVRLIHLGQCQEYGIR